MSISDGAVRVLVVDDDLPAQESFERLLREDYPNAIIETAVNLGEASRAIEEHQFDLAIADVDLGEGEDKLGGMRIMKLLEGTDTPCLVVSGLPERVAISAEALRALSVCWSAWDFLEKPYEDDEFKALVKAALTDREDAERERSAHVDPHISFESGKRNRSVLWKGQRVLLSLTRVEMLHLFLANIGRDIAFAEFYPLFKSGKNKENLRNHISDLQTAFREADPTFARIQPVPMFGYKWVL